MWPTEPFTTIVMPFIEMPQREAASPSTISMPPRPEAPAPCEQLPVTCTRPDIMFSATPGPAWPWMVMWASLFMPPQ